MKREIERNSAAEDAAIQLGIVADQDNPEWSGADFAAAVPASAMPAMAAHARRTRGPQKTPTKQQVALRLDRDVLEALRAGGGRWQTRANELLRKAVLGHVNLRNCGAGMLSKNERNKR
jgi:uncharacterized protein (DUF4415 family)